MFQGSSTPQPCMAPCSWFAGSQSKSPVFLTLLQTSCHVFCQGIRCCRGLTAHVSVCVCMFAAAETVSQRVSRPNSLRLSSEKREKNQSVLEPWLHQLATAMGSCLQKPQGLFHRETCLKAHQSKPGQHETNPGLQSYHRPRMGLSSSPFCLG